MWNYLLISTTQSTMWNYSATLQSYIQGSSWDQRPPSELSTLAAPTTNGLRKSEISSCHRKSLLLIENRCCHRKSLLLIENRCHHRKSESVVASSHQISKICHWRSKICTCCHFLWKDREGHPILLEILKNRTTEHGRDSGMWEMFTTTVVRVRYVGQSSSRHALTQSSVV